jgi:hypothetical protein
MTARDHRDATVGAVVSAILICCCNLPEVRLSGVGIDERTTQRYCPTDKGPNLLPNACMDRTAPSSLQIRDLQSSEPLLPQEAHRLLRGVRVVSIYSLRAEQTRQAPETTFD